MVSSRLQLAFGSWFGFFRTKPVWSWWVMAKMGHDDALTHAAAARALAKRLKRHAPMAVWSSVPGDWFQLPPWEIYCSWTRDKLQSTSCTVSFWQILPRHDQLFNLTVEALDQIRSVKKKSEKNTVSGFTVFKIAVSWSWNDDGMKIMPKPSCTAGTPLHV
jgi:hypothetical protein